MDLKRKNISLLVRVFQEYVKIFSDIFIKSSTEKLLHSLLPENLLSIDTEDLATLLNTVSKGRFGKTRTLNKALQLKDSALNTFGISMGTDVFKMQIKLLLEQIALIEKHLKQIETVMIELSNRQGHFLKTITGISDVTACVIQDEIGSIKRFE